MSLETPPLDSPREKRGRSPLKRRDLKAHVLASMVRLRAHVPGWHVQTLGVLATAEAEGVRLLQNALPSIDDVRLRRTYLQHLEDEKRHATGFAQFYRELSGAAPPPARHGHTTTSQSLLEFFAFLEQTELRGFEMMQNYRPLFAGYPSVQGFIEQVLKDENFHATYLRRQLDRLSKSGLEAEVAAARRAAARTDSLGFWIQVVRFLRASPRIIAAIGARAIDSLSVRERD